MTPHYSYLRFCSGAHTSSENLSQIFDMHGHTTNYLGEVIELSNYFFVMRRTIDIWIFYFCIWSFKRNDRCTVSLKIAKAGYLTCRLVESSQDVVFSLPDCETSVGINAKITENDAFNTINSKVYGHCVVNDIFDEEKMFYCLVILFY